MKFKKILSLLLAIVILAGSFSYNIDSYANTIQCKRWQHMMQYQNTFINSSPPSQMRAVISGKTNVTVDSPLTQSFNFEGGEGSKPGDINSSQIIYANIGDSITLTDRTAGTKTRWDFQRYYNSNLVNSNHIYNSTQFPFTETFTQPGTYSYYLNVGNSTDWSSHGNYRVLGKNPDTGVFWWWYFTEIKVVVSDSDKVVVKYQDIEGKTLRPDDAALNLSSNGFNNVYPNTTKHNSLNTEGYTLKSPQAGYHLVYNGNQGKVHTVIFKYEPPLGAYATVGGTANPNPVTLSGGKGTTSITATGRVFNLPGGVNVQSMKLLLNNPKTNTWLDKNFVSTNTQQEHNFGEFEVTETTIFPIKVEAQLTNGKTVIADGQVIVSVQEPVSPPGDWDITANAWILPTPKLIKMSLKEFNSNKGTEVSLLFNVTDSFATHGIDKYQYSVIKELADWHTPDGSFQSSWVSPKNYTDKLIYYPSDADPNTKLVYTTGKLGVRDNQGNIKYFWFDADPIAFEVVIAPPETELQLPDVFYPREVTDLLGIKNEIAWSYFSDDDVPYDHSIVSLYKLDVGETPIFENQIQTDRQLEIIGEAGDEFKIVVKVVDELNNESAEAVEIFTIIEASPVINVTVDPSRENENLLGVTVENLTPSHIESVFPTNYTNWVIRDAKGNMLNEGLGKVPGWVAMDERYRGTVAVVTQFASNIIGRIAYDKDYYKNNSSIDFVIDPDRLFEGELAQITDFSRALENKEWKIKEIYAADFEELHLDNEMKFTKDKGRYNVLLEGDGVFGMTRVLYHYSNSRKELRSDNVKMTEEKVKTLYGDNNTYVVNSEDWFEPIQEGPFNIQGATYNYRRRYSFITIETTKLNGLKGVEFLNGKPTPVFDLDGNLGLQVAGYKMHKKITADATASIAATDAELQAKYPILWNHPRTRYVIEPLVQLGGEIDTTKNQYVYGLGKDSIIDNGKEKIIFPGSTEHLADIRHFRSDIDGPFKVSLKLFNGLKESDWVSKEIVVMPELWPSIDINAGQPVIYRNPDNQLKSQMQVIVHYGVDQAEVPLDTIDLEKSILYIHYDEDGVFSGDLEASQWIGRDSENLEDYISVVQKEFTQTYARFILEVDNETKNKFGHFKFEFKAIEKPTVPNYEVPPELPIVPEITATTESIDDIKKRIFIDNQKPIIHLSMRKEHTAELDSIKRI